MGKKRKGLSARKNRPQVDVEPATLVNAPHSFVLHRGTPCPYVALLTHDFRRIMEPFTASALKERKNNKIKDFLSISGHFHVSHMCIFNRAKHQLSFKIARLPRGPTLSFKVHQFTLARDVIASTRKQHVEEVAFHNAPLIILNNFNGGGKHVKLMANTFQNMFPAINLATVQLSTMKRCVLLSFNPINELIDLRHYAVTVTPVGITRGIKKVVLGKIPNMAKCEDIADFITGETIAGESEYEDDERGEVILPQTLKSRGNIENNKSAIKLYEMGPRLTLQLTKIEEGLLNGEVLYHNSIVKTEEEQAKLKMERRRKHKLKEARKKIQMENQLKKQNEREGMQEEDADEERRNEHSDDDDANYYKQEVGEEPDEDLFSKNEPRKRGFIPKFMRKGNQAKKRKFEETKNRSSNKQSSSNNRDNAKKKRFNKK